MSINTASIVQASAQIVTITEIKRGNVVKRLAKDYSDTYRIILGVVLDVMHNGTDAAFTLLEFDSQFSSTEVEVKTYGTDSDLKLFHATPEEVEEGMERAEANLRSKVKEKFRELEKAESTLARALEAKEMASKAGLTEATYKTIEA